MAMKPQVLIFRKKKSSSAEGASNEICKWLRNKKIGVLDVSGQEEKIMAEVTRSVVLGVCIGGDGTFLRLVRRLEEKDAFPLMGVNLGNLGFITEFSREEMLKAVEDSLAKKYPEEKRALMLVEHWRNKKCIESGSFFNDAVLNKDARTTMMRMEVSVDGQLLSNLGSDGYIISTATGSTAYNLSAGGPILHPMAGAMVLSPICSHSLSSRPVVIPTSALIDVHLGEFKGSAYLVYDGQINFELEPGDSIRVKPSGKQLRLIRSPRKPWTEAIRSKLRMG